MRIQLAQQPEADELLGRSTLALLVGKVWEDVADGAELLRRLMALPGGVHRSVADVVDAGSLELVRAAKQEAKRAAKK